MNGGANSKANPSSYTIATAFSLQPATREGYEFKGWYNNPGFLGEVISSIREGTTGALEFFARWFRLGWGFDEEKDDWVFYKDDRIVTNDWIYAEDPEGTVSGKHYYYAGCDGTLLKNCVEEIEGKKYAFDENGIRMEGLVLFEDPKYTYPSPKERGMTSREWSEVHCDADIMYFKPEMKTGGFSCVFSDGECMLFADEDGMRHI